MPTSHILNLDYVVDQDSASPFTSPELALSHPLDGVFYQFAWDAEVKGQFIFEATIFPGKWESFLDCGELKVIADGNAGHKIVCIPQAWYLVSKLRFRWVPSLSSGNFSVALRLIPK